MSTARYTPLSQGGVSTSSPLRRFSRRQVLYILLSLLSLSFLLGLGGYTTSVHKRVSPAKAKAWFKANVVGSAYYPSWLPQLNPSTSDNMLKALTTIPGGWAAYDKNENDNYRWVTEAKLRQLTACLARGDCPENADKIVVLGGWHCQWALHDDYHGGEGVWCLGLYRSLERQGFTVLQGGDNDYGELCESERSEHGVAREEQRRACKLACLQRAASASSWWQSVTKRPVTSHPGRDSAPAYPCSSPAHPPLHHSSQLHQLRRTSTPADTRRIRLPPLSPVWGLYPDSARRARRREAQGDAGAVSEDKGAPGRHSGVEGESLAWPGGRHRCCYGDANRRGESVPASSLPP